MSLIGAGIRKSVTAVAIVALVGASGLLVSAISSAPNAFAIPGQGTPFDCTGGTIYNVQQGSGTNGILNALSVGGMSGTTAVPATQVSTTIPSNTPNALGISEGGVAAWALAPQSPTNASGVLTFQLRSYNPTTQAWTTHAAMVDTTGRLPAGVTAANIASNGIVAGAVDPLSGNFYWAYYASAQTGGSITFFGWNTATNTSLGVVATSVVPQALPSTGNANGDFAFDSQGNVLVVSNVGTSAALGVIEGPLPTAPQTSPPFLADTRLAAYSNPNANSYNGIAFDNTGNLFLEYTTSAGATVILKINPNTGAILAGPAPVSYSGSGGTLGTDLGGCSVPPVMELMKNVVNRQRPTDQFNLSITGGGLSSGNTATTTGTATGVQAATAGPVVGVTGTTYTFSETAAGTTNLANYTTTYQCVDDADARAVVASGTGTSFTLTLTAGEVGKYVVCTFTNTTLALTLVKQVNNGNSGATTAATAWTLTAAGTAGLPTISGPTGSAAVTNAAVPPGTYTLSEAGGPAGYTPSAWSCTGATSFTATTVTVALGQNVTCTIINTAVPPKLTLVKVVVNAHGGTEVDTAWTLTAAGPVTISGVTGAAAVTAAAVRIGTYDLSESGPTGYAASAWDCTGATSFTAASVTLALGDNATCTVTNSDIPPTLTLVKHVVNTHGGTATATEWTLTAAGPVTISGATGSTTVTDAAVSAGTYDLSESGGPAGYIASGWDCTGATSFTAASVTLVLDEHATCTITNSDIAPTLTLVKVVDENGSGANTPVTAWTLTAAGPVRISGATGSTAVTNAEVHAGTYDLTEAGPAGYSASAWVCTGATSSTAGSVTLALDQNAICTIVNTAIPPTLTLVKEVVNAHGGTAVDTDWTLTATGPVTISGVTGSPAVTGATVEIGTYRLSETGGPAGYSPSAWSCVSNATGLPIRGPRLFEVTLALAENVTCTITNTDLPTFLTLVKQVDNGTTGATTAATAWTLTATGPALISGVTGSPAVTGAIVAPGTYTLTEAGPGGYTPSAWSCVGATSSTATSVTVDLNENVTCTITNTAIPPELTLVKKVVNGNTRATIPATAWTLTAKGPAELSGATGSAAVTGVVVTVGTYQLRETGPTGYKVSAWVCTGAASSNAASVTIAVGNRATCTITNTAIDPRLTLVKQVVNAHGGTARATDWTLAAAGPVTIDGPTGTAPVTSAIVPVGAYRLSESGPSGYMASSWTCTGATLDGSTVEIVSGTVAVCTIVNTQLPPPAVIETPGASTAPPPDSSSLAFTGENALGEIQGGLAALFIGGVVLIVNRRRRT